MDAESKPLVQAPRGGVRTHDVQERDLAAREFTPHDLDHEPPRVATALEVGMRAHAAHFAKTSRVHALARHRDQAPVFEAAVVLAELDRAQAKRPGIGELRELERLCGM